MLKLERFAVEIDMLALLNSEVQIEEISVKGLHAKLYQERRDTAANYQFVIDAFKKDKKTPEKKPKEDQKKKKKNLPSTSSVPSWRMSTWCLTSSMPL